MEPIQDQAVNQAKAGPAQPQGAGPLLRLGAFAIDVFLVGLAFWGWGIAVWREAPLSAPFLVPAGGAVIAIVYYVWAITRNYHTVGQGFAGLTLARIDYKPLTVRRAYWRLALFGFTSGMVVPNAVIMLFDKRRRTIHDLATKTWVYEIPDYDPRRRKAVVWAGVLLVVGGLARGILSLTDGLEGRTRLTMEDVAAGADGGAAPSSTTAAGFQSDDAPPAGAIPLVSSAAATSASTVPEVSTASARSAALEAYEKTLAAERPVPDFAAVDYGRRSMLDSFGCWHRPALFYFFPAGGKDSSAGAVSALRERYGASQLCLIPVPRPAPGTDFTAAIDDLLRKDPKTHVYGLLRLWPGPVPESGPAAVAFSRTGTRTELTAESLRDPRRVAALIDGLLADGSPEAAADMEDDQARAAEEPERAAFLEAARSEQQMIVNRDFDGLDGRVRDLRETRQLDQKGDWLLSDFYRQLYGTDDASRPARTEFLKEWIAARPRSAAPRVALGWTWILAAYGERGGRPASELSPQKRQAIQDRLAEAEKVLAGARPLARKDPAFYEAMLALALAREWPRQKADELFREGAAVDPLYPGLYLAMQRYLLPEAYGALGEWEAFYSSETAKIAGGEGDALYARLVVLTAREGPFGAGGSAVFRATKLSWPQTRRGFMAMLKADRDSRYVQNWFAFFACAAEDRKTASALFRKIGDDYVSEVWANRANYEHYRAWAKKPSGG